ncbi:MAG: M56 family metallopeptidase [Steroidobacteraceae bacterium]
MWLLGAWCVGVALFAVYLAGAQRVFVNNLGELSGSRRVLRAEHAAGCPALLGVIHPKIVLPCDFETRYTRLERLLIFSHERAHLRHGDAAWNALVALLRCLFWFNPLVHLAATRFRVDQELACDAAVVGERPGSQRSYASAMLKSELSESALPVGCHWQSVRHFKERLLMLKQTIPGRARRTCGLVCVTLSSVLVGYAAWAAEPILNVAQQTASDDRPVQLRGGLVVTTIDDRRMLVGVSSGANRKIGDIFLYTSQGPTGFKLNIVGARSTIDYRPGMGLRFTLPDPHRHAPAGFAIFLGAGGRASSVDENSVTPKVKNPIGVSLGLSHYGMHPALTPGEFEGLRKTDNCNGAKAPCVRAAGKIISFPG